MSSISFQGRAAMACWNGIQTPSPAATMKAARPRKGAGVRVRAAAKNGKFPEFEWMNPRQKRRLTIKPAAVKELSRVVARERTRGAAPAPSRRARTEGGALHLPRWRASDGQYTSPFRAIFLNNSFQGR